MNCIAVIPFSDLEKDVDRKVGDSFSCSDERARYLASLGLVTAEPEKAEAEKTEKPKRPARKRTTKRGE